ncbi:MAG: ABC transporter ATP-binding protein/permease [Gemmatimonadaceae bacterium]|nr:ABC transporter ATP-binding protein/permease [Gemmatimonadaceae bacterium]
MPTVRSPQVLRRLLPYYHPYRGQVAVGLASVVVAAALSTLVPGFLQRGIDALRDGAHTREVMRPALLMLTTALAAGVLRFVMRELLNGLSRRIETDLRRDLFARLTGLDAAWYARWRTGDLMARLTNDLSAVRMAAGPALMYFVNTVAGGLFALGMMLRLSPSLTLWALLPMVGLPLLMLRLGRLVHARFEAVQQEFAQLTTRAQENLSGVRVVRAFRQEDAEVARFRALGETYLASNMRLARLNGLMSPGFALLAGLGGAITVGVGGAQLLEGRITVGEFVAFGIYLAMLTWPLIALGWTTNLFQRGAASLARVLELLDTEPVLVHDRGTRVLPPTSVGRRLSFRGVGFHYPVADGAAPRWVLRNLTFDVPAGTTLAIVGATGSGKSALLDLVTRAYDPQEGEILVDDVPLTELALGPWRAELGAVPQEALLFSETIGENVAYGLTRHDQYPQGDDVLARISEAARTAQLLETITALPDGFATRLGERGINLSGGQKQRTALARALARNPSVVLLDDALSAVDTQTEAAILHGLRDALASRTALVASHRLSAVRDAEHIIVLDGGRVVQSGTHEQLLREGGRYADLLQRQQWLEDIEAA